MGGGLIKDLEVKGFLKRISGSGLRERNNRLNDSDIENIIIRYASKCPNGFEVDVTNYKRSNKRYVLCKRKKFNCPLEYVRFHVSDGYLGCQKLASCEESGEGYVEFGDETQCAVCQAGGWVDQAKNKILCKVNIKNSEDESVCVEEIKKVYEKIGDVTREHHFKHCQSMMMRQYDNQGRLMLESRGSHKNLSLLKGTFSVYYSDGTLKNEGERKNNITIWEKKYNQKGQLTAEYRDGKWER